MQVQTLVNVKYQVVIPKAIRKKIQIKPGQKMNVEVAGEKVILSKAQTKKQLEWPGRITTLKLPTLSIWPQQF